MPGYGPERLVSGVRTACLIADLTNASGRPANRGSIRGLKLAVGRLYWRTSLVRSLRRPSRSTKPTTALFELADTIEQRVQTGTQRADKLTQSVLAKAFRGELVPTEAELARREGRDYESASVPLARIRAERGEWSQSQKPGGRISRKRQRRHG